MTRSKVSLQYITNDFARKSTFKKRRAGIMKKAGELSTLCGVDVCVIMFNPIEPEPDVWPPQLEVQRIIAKFRNLSEIEQNSKMMNLEGFTRERLTKCEKQVMKQQRVNRHDEMSQVMYQCLTGRGFENLSIDDLKEIGGLLSQKVRDIDMRIEFLTRTNANGQGNG